MKKIFKKNIIIYLLLIFYMCFVNLFNFTKNTFFLNYGNAIIWIVLSIITFLFVGFKSRVKDKYGKIQTLFIFAIAYIIVYFLLGLIFSFEYSPYSKNILAIFINFINLVAVIALYEYIRCSLINYNSDIISKIIVTTIFIFININFSEFLNSFNTYDELFKYLFGTLAPLIARESLFTYLASSCGYKGLLTFRLPFQLITIIAPIFPKLNWYVLSTFNLVYYFLVFYTINTEYFTEVDRREKRKTLFYIPILGLIVLLICFVLGLFKYAPFAIMSNSMKPYFERGDVVIISDIEQKNVKDLKIGDIIVYRIENSRVIHRIAEIKENNGELYFRTKGDNNPTVDKDYVKEGQVEGTVKMVIPIIGYPTVWLSEIFNSTKPNVGMGEL